MGHWVLCRAWWLQVSSEWLIKFLSLLPGCHTLLKTTTLISKIPRCVHYDPLPQPTRNTGKAAQLGTVCLVHHYSQCFRISPELLLFAYSPYPACLSLQNQSCHWCTVPLGSIYSLQWCIRIYGKQNTTRRASPHITSHFLRVFASTNFILSLGKWGTKRLARFG